MYKPNSTKNDNRWKHARILRSSVNLAKPIEKHLISAADRVGAVAVAVGADAAVGETTLDRKDTQSQFYNVSTNCIKSSMGKPLALPLYRFSHSATAGDSRGHKAIINKVTKKHGIVWTHYINKNLNTYILKSWFQVGAPALKRCSIEATAPHESRVQLCLLSTSRLTRATKNNAVTSLAAAMHAHTMLLQLLLSPLCSIGYETLTW